MKKVTFFGYVENCPCTFCKTIRSVIEMDKKAHINSFKIEDCEQTNAGEKME